MNVNKIKATRLRGTAVLALIALVVSTAIVGAGAFAPSTPLFGLTNPTSSIDFGRRKVNFGGDTIVVGFTNAGVGTLTITGVTFAGANPADFPVVSNTCGNSISLLPGGQCGIQMGFKPTAVGVRSARIVVTSNAPNSPHTIPVGGVGLDPNIPNRAVSASNPLHGFPYWYQDDAGMRLQLCLDDNGLCLSTALDPTRPAAVSDTFINFPGEAFWWAAEAEIPRGVGDDALLVLAKEAAFTTEDAAVGKQISFDRVRVRIDSLVPGATYTVTYPFGVKTFVADDAGEINDTEDIGCGAAPCDFRASLVGRITHFLRWDPAFAPLAPSGYVGDPNTPHRVTGSPFNTNIFKVDGPNVGGSGVNSIQTNLFSVQGKLF